MGNLEVNEAIGRQFLDALAEQDWQAMRQLFSNGALWSMPGSNSTFSATVVGPDALVDRARGIVASGVHIEVLHVLVGQAGVALSLHNTAQNAIGQRLDQHLATVLTVMDGKITAVDTYLSDVAGMEAFFRS
jgi:hypothetical protein